MLLALATEMCVCVRLFLCARTNACLYYFSSFLFFLFCYLCFLFLSRPGWPDHATVLDDCAFSDCMFSINIFPTKLCQRSVQGNWRKTQARHQSWLFENSLIWKTFTFWCKHWSRDRELSNQQTDIRQSRSQCTEQTFIVFVYLGKTQDLVRSLFY